MKTFFTLLTTTCAALGVHAQNGNRISGLVQDADGKPLAAATVSLLRAKDSSLAKLAVTDKNGQFEISGIAAGRYLMSYTSVGFSRSYSAPFEATASVDLPAVALSRASKEMTGVTVVARKPLVEARLDKMVVNVDASPTNAGTSALEVLEKSPGITLDRDGNVSLKGRNGVIILVDGKQTFLSGQDLTNMLRNLPSSQLDQIEIMTQPSAKYDAAGNAGVINLRTKKGLQKGLNGSVSLSYVQGRYPKSPNNFSLNYRTGKVNLFTSLSASYFEGFNELNLQRRFRNSSGVFDTTFAQTSYGRWHGKNLNARLGMDYNIDKKTTIGFMINGGTNPRGYQGESVADLVAGNGQLQRTNIALSNNRDKWKNAGFNLNFRKQLKKQGAEFSMDADYVLYRTQSNQVSDNREFDAAKNPFGVPYYLHGTLNQNIDILSAKTDYATPLGKGGKLELGAKSSYVKTDNNAPYLSRNHSTGVDTVDARSDHFIYEENINAAYANYSRQLKKLSYQLGLRMEHTHSIGNSIATKTRVVRDYVQLFPTAFLSYKADEKNTVGLSYSRRLERPNYQDLNPFQRILDQYTYQQGNPYLTPQFAHNVELSHNFRGIINTVVNYSKTEDIISEVLKQNDVEKKSFQTRENIASSRMIGLAVSANLPVKKWWFVNIYTNVVNSRFKGFVNNTILDAGFTSFNANFSQQFRLQKGWTLEQNGFFRSKSLEGGLMMAEPMGVISFGVSKSVLQNKGTIKLNISDPFWIQQFRGNVNFGNINTSIHSRWDNRRVGLAFTYRFSKGQSAPQQRRRSSSAQDELNRVGGGQQ